MYKSCRTLETMCVYVVKKRIVEQCSRACFPFRKENSSLEASVEVIGQCAIEHTSH